MLCSYQGREATVVIVRNDDDKCDRSSQSDEALRDTEKIDEMIPMKWLCSGVHKSLPSVYLRDRCLSGTLAGVVPGGQDMHSAWSHITPSLRGW